MICLVEDGAECDTWYLGGGESERSKGCRKGLTLIGLMEPTLHTLRLCVRSHCKYALTARTRTDASLRVELGLRLLFPLELM